MAVILRRGLQIWHLFIGTSWGHRDIDLLNVTFLYDGRLSRKNKLITLLHSPQSSANTQNRWINIWDVSLRVTKNTFTGRFIFYCTSGTSTSWTVLNIAGGLPAKEVVPLERIHLLEFRFLQQAVTQSWVYGHITVGRQREFTKMSIIWWTELTLHRHGVGGQVASPTQDTHMWLLCMTVEWRR